MKNTEVSRFLARSDKWYLGGNRLLSAPPFPAHLDSPGFWDEAHYYNYELKPLFTWTLLTESGELISLKSQGREWKPSVLTQQFTCSLDGRRLPLRVIEKKCILSNDVATSMVHIKNTSRKRVRVHFVAWTVHEHYPLKESLWLDDISHDRGVLTFKKFVRPSVDPRLEIGCAFSLNRRPRSYAINLSERTALQPRWDLTPWGETFGSRGLPNESRLTGVTNEGLVYLALHSPIAIAAGQEEAVGIGFGAAPGVEESRSNLYAAMRQNDPTALGALMWDEYFASVPNFGCSDEYLQRSYWYRWYGLKLNTQHGSEGNYRRPFVCEGIGYFRAPISYSAPCHMRETRWMHEPELAQGSLLTFIDNQRDDGGFRGSIDVNHYRQDMFYHANWGTALQQLHFIHPSVENLDCVYTGLKKYVGYFDRERDEEVSGLYDIDNHYETGQEFMHRYTAVNPNADQDNWGEVFRLKGVDVTVYIYALKRALTLVAERLGKPDEAELWTIEADRIKTAILDKMWDKNEEMFFDVDPATGGRTMVKAATCFYPYFTETVDESHLPGLKRHLLNPGEFWTRFPVPSSSRDDEFYSAVPEWKGKRMNCPWNGRVWPMTNSHIAEALAISAIRFDDALLRKKSAEFITKFVRMMFFKGDPHRPNSFEHYNPQTGAPSTYRGVDDYQHSWVNDLIIKYVCGIRPDEFSVVIDPFPFKLKELRIGRVFVRGRMLAVTLKGKNFSVWLDGKHHAESVIGKPIQIQI